MAEAAHEPAPQTIRCPQGPTAWIVQRPMGVEHLWAAGERDSAPRAAFQASFSPFSLHLSGRKTKPAEPLLSSRAVSMATHGLLLPFGSKCSSLEHPHLTLRAGSENSQIS